MTYPLWAVTDAENKAMTNKEAIQYRYFINLVVLEVGLNGMQVKVLRTYKVKTLPLKDR
ncbi:hypothetical protein TUMSATVNIG1_56760 (plasmid) [Vibrio nigripulchritudo]|nr:hypothetical protein VNTUMSATTG_56300 [Vibrio nigripulchritudo]BDU35067.1 hypothetical protein TUMSATVNIG1_56760 [Vibrio nigripulchritudo]